MNEKGAKIFIILNTILLLATLYRWIDGDEFRNVVLQLVVNGLLYVVGFGMLKQIKQKKLLNEKEV